MNTGIGMLDVDLAALPERGVIPLPPCDGHDAPGSARVLVFEHGDPLGWLDLPAPGGAVSTHAVRAAAGIELLDARRRSALRRAFEARVPRARLPSLTAAVCTHDRPELLARCLAALTTQALPVGATFTILVVDNAPSDDRTRRLVEGTPGVRYVREERQGLDFARNRALAECTTDWIAFVDDDATAHPRWAAALLDAAARGDCVAITGPVVPAELRTAAQVRFEEHGGFGRGFAARRFTRLPASALPLYAPGACGAGCNMAFDRAFLAAVGGFDPRLDAGRRLPGGGDLDVFCRVLRAGGVLWYEPRAVVRHLHRPEIRALRRQIYDWGRGYTAFLTANFLDRPGERGMVLRAAAWWALRYQLGTRLFGRLLGRHRARVTDVLLELLGGLVGPFTLLAMHRHVRRSS